VTDGIDTRLPSWSRERLEMTAAAHASVIVAERGWDGPAPAVETLTVNMLRHEFTSYDEDQSDRSHAAACRAIAAKYPWLAGECDRQSHRRAAREREERAFMQMWRDQRDETREWRAVRVARSREAVTDLTVGQVVKARIRGHDRKAKIVKVARSRVTVEFVINSGASQDSVIYASDVAR